MTRLFDPFYAPHVAHRTPADIDRCLDETVADLLAAANDPDRPRKPLTHAELEADADTKIRGGKSRRALARERRPVQFGPYDEFGYDRNGNYDPAADGRW